METKKNIFLDIKKNNFWEYEIFVFGTFCRIRVITIIIHQKAKSRAATRVRLL